MIPDAKTRAAAVTDPGHLFVRASAGTGKTHTLTLRALHLLLQAPFDPRAKGKAEAELYSGNHRATRLAAARAVSRRFVLTTFTRKAAAEMQDRLSQYLEKLASARDEATLVREVNASNEQRGDAQFLEVLNAARARVGDFAALARGAAALAECAAELQIITLHSFAASILRRHPIAAGIPSGAEFAEEDDGLLPDPSRRLVDRWLERVLADPKLRAQLEVILPVAPLEEQRAWGIALLKHPWIADELDFAQPTPRDLDKLLAFFRDLVAQLASTNYRKIRAAREDLSAACAKVEEGRSGAWRALHRSLGKHGGTWFDPPKIVSKAVGSLDPEGRWFGKDEARRLLVRQILTTDLAKEWNFWRDHVRAFCRWAKDAAIHELNLVTFDEMIRRAAELLRNDPEARKAERERLWALLVDEFQDTDPVQLDILRSLLSRRSDEPEALGFFVGDAKQSIYRFRNADLPAIEAFAQGYAAMVGLADGAARSLTLRASFRTKPQILGFVNHFFEKCVPLPDYAGDRLEAVRREPAPSVEWRILLPKEEGKRSAEENRRAAAREVARLIRAHLASAQNREDALREVLVLVPTQAEINALLPALEEAEIPAVSVGTRSFFARPEVLDALNLLLALHHPLDAVAVVALLRSPLFGCSDPEIHALLAKTPPAKIFHGNQPLPEVREAAWLGRLLEARELARDRRRLPLAEWLGRVRDFIPEGVYAAGDGEGRALARMERVLEDFRRAAESGAIPPLAWLLDQRARADGAGRHDADLGEDLGVSDERAPAVRVMTIHKAKGLEGKFVIVNGWTKTLGKCDPSRETKEIVRITAEDGKPLRAFSLKWGGMRVTSEGYAAALDQDRRMQAEEGRRLLYVAATRARDRLVLISEEEPDLKKGVLSEAVSGGEMKGLQDALGAHAAIAFFDEGNPAPRVGDGVRTVRDAEGYAKLWKPHLDAVKSAPAPLMRRPSAPEHPEEEESFDAEDCVARRRATARETARLAGVLVHAYLERHARDAAFDPEKFAQMLESKAEEGESSEGRAKAAKILGAFFGSTGHARLRAGRVLGQEMPVYLRTNGEAWNGVLDLVFEEKGRIVGVDFKTSPPPSSLPPEYEVQRRVYTQALRSISGGSEVEFEFWWLTAKESEG